MGWKSNSMYQGVLLLYTSTKTQLTISYQEYAICFWYASCFVLVSISANDKRRTDKKKSAVSALFLFIKLH